MTNSFPERFAADMVGWCNKYWPESFPIPGLVEKAGDSGWVEILINSIPHELVQAGCRVEMVQDPLDLAQLRSTEGGTGARAPRATPNKLRELRRPPRPAKRKFENSRELRPLGGRSEGGTIWCGGRIFPVPLSLTC